MMKKMFNFGNDRKVRKPHSSGKAFQPHMEPLEERQLLSMSSVLQNGVISDTFAKAQNFAEYDMTVKADDAPKGSSPVIAIRVDSTSATFNPAALTILDSKGVKVPESAISFKDENFNNGKSSLLVVQLAPGDYKLRIAGDASSYGTFKCDVFLPGDLNHNGAVSNEEYVFTNGAYARSAGKWNAVTIAAVRAAGFDPDQVKPVDENDIDGDGKITVYELEAAATNSIVGKVSVTIINDKTPPTVTVGLVTDDGLSNTDKITSKAPVQGKVTDDTGVGEFKGSFNNGTNWTDLAPLIQPDGKYVITEDVMKTMTGGPFGTNGTPVEGTYTLKLFAADKLGNETTQTLTFVFIPNNVAPVAKAASFTTGEKTPITSQSLADKVSDPNKGDKASFVAQTVTSEKGVSVTITADGKFTYNQGDKFASLNVSDTATDTFKYKVRDTFGLETEGTVTITVTGINDAPVAKNVTGKTTDQDTSLAINVLTAAYVSDVDNDLSTLSIQNVTQPAKGKVTFANGTITFDPGDAFKSLRAGETETAEFNYTVKDPGGLTATAKITITVSGKNDPIVAVNDTGATDAKTAVVIDVLANDKTVDHDDTKTLVAGGLTQPSKGKVTIENGKVKFDPNGQFNTLATGATEKVTFKYKVSNHAGQESEATVTVTVTGVNTAPTVSKLYTFTINEKESKAISIADLLTGLGASDINVGDVLTISAVNSPSTQGVAVTLSGSNVVYNPGSKFYSLKEGQTATDPFTVTVSDGKGGTVTGTVNVTITGVNDPFSVANQTLSVTSSETGTYLSAGSIAVTDLDIGDTYKFEMVGTPTGGPSGAAMPDIKVDPNTGAVTISKANLPAKTNNGEEYVLTIKVSDPRNLSGPQTATIKIKVVENQPPKAVNVTINNVAEKATTDTVQKITGVTDPEGDAFEFLTTLQATGFTINGAAQTVPTGFTATMTADGTFTFNPKGKFNSIPQGKTGVLTVVYTVRDTFGGQSTGTITINIVGANDAPVAKNVAVSAATTTPKDAAKLIDYSATDVDLGDTLSIDAASLVQPSKGEVTVVGNQFKFDPKGQFNTLGVGQTETVTFKYKVKDQNGTLSNEATISVQITGKNTSHTVADQTMTVLSNSTGTNIVVGTLVVNDIDGPNGSYAYSITSGATPVGGPTFSIDNTGKISVTKAGLPATGSYTLTVEVKDADYTVSAKVTVNVVQKAPPVVPTTPATLTILEKPTADGTVTITGVTNGGDPFEFLTTLTPLSFKIDGTTYNASNPVPTGYKATITKDGKVTFNPNGAFNMIPEGKNGTLELQYSVKDTASGATATGKIVITITGVNDTPTAIQIPLTTDQNTKVSIDVFEIDPATKKYKWITDPDIDDTFTLTLGTKNGNGSFTKGTGGNVTFDPGTDFKSLAQGQTASSSITYTVTDKAGKTAQATITVTITGLNDPPTAVNDSQDSTGKRLEVYKDAKLTIDVLANDSDIDNETPNPLTIATVNGNAVAEGQTVTLASGATVKLQGGKLIYDPNGKYNSLGKGKEQTITFGYVIKDKYGATSNTATVTIVVMGKNDSPVLKQSIPDLAQDMGTSITLKLNDYFTDPNGDPLSFSITKGSDPSNMITIGTVDSNGNVKITFNSDYTTASSRNPVVITVTAFKTSDSTAKTTTTFTALAKPQTTAGLTLVAVKTPSANNATTVPTGTTEFTVGEDFYLEFWAQDFINTTKANFSAGLQAVVATLNFDGRSVEFVLDDPTDPTSYASYGKDISFPSPHQELGIGTANASLAHFGGMNLTTAGLGLGKSWFVGSIHLKVTGTTPSNFTIVKDATLELNRTAGTGDPSGENVDIDPSQITVTIPTITYKTALLAAESPEVVQTGGVYTRVVATPTEVSAAGTVAAIPNNADWINEWQTHWVEVWVKESDVNYMLNASVNLNYNPNYFTASQIENGGVFTNGFAPVIKQGKITGFGGEATKLVKGDGYVLLGRVKFEPVSKGGVSANEMYAHDLGISMEKASVQSSDGTIFSYAGKSPKTELWAVAYDTNDDGIVNMNDFANFYNNLQKSYSSSESQVLLGDYDRSGSVNMNDFAYFYKNLYASAGGTKSVVFPTNFTQRYVGKTLNADNTATVSTIIDAANKAWQTALGLNKPVNIQIVVKDLSNIGNGKELANAQITAVDAQGRPISGIITLDDDAAGLGWYSQLAEPVANGRYDLYTTLLHEMGHVYGFTTTYDAFNAVVGNYLSQVDSTKLHAADSGDVMFATLTTGVRKFISQLDVSIIGGAYSAAAADSKLRGFSTGVKSLTSGENAALPAVDQTAFVRQNDGSTGDGSVVTSLRPATTAMIENMTGSSSGRSMDQVTDMQLRALGLAVSMPVNQSVKKERKALDPEQIYRDDALWSFVDDGVVKFHQSKSDKPVETGFDLFDLSFDWNG